MAQPEEQAHGPQSAQLSDVHYNIHKMLADQPARLSDACAHLAKSLAIDTARLGASHRTVVRSRAALEALHAKQTPTLKP